MKTNSFIDWGKWYKHKTEESSWLDPKCPTLDFLFKNYFDAFQKCVEFADFFHDKYGHLEGHYLPLRTVVVNLPSLANDSDRPLVEYDNLEGKPFWLAGSSLDG